MFMLSAFEARYGEKIGLKERRFRINRLTNCLNTNTRIPYMRLAKELFTRIYTVICRKGGRRDYGEQPRYFKFSMRRF